MMGLTFLPDITYTAVVFVGFALFGLGLGIYATPSTDTSVSNAPSDKVGQAAGVYKMASSLGGAFGVAISAAVYGSDAARGNLGFSPLYPLSPWSRTVLARRASAKKSEWLSLTEFF